MKLSLGTKERREKWVLRCVRVCVCVKAKENEHLFFFFLLFFLTDSSSFLGLAACSSPPHSQFHSPLSLLLFVFLPAALPLLFSFLSLLPPTSLLFRSDARNSAQELNATPTSCSLHPFYCWPTPLLAPLFFSKTHTFLS